LFTKKYVFETRKTRTKRIFRSIVIISSLICVSFTLLCIYIPIYAEKQNEATAQAFFKRSPDLIAVFTGDTGRIDYTLKKAEKHPSAKIFITGVYAKNNLKILLKKQGKDISVDDYLEQESHHIELDYLARNTIENGLATIHYMEKLSTVKNVLIISSDYHMLRISTIMSALSDQNSEFKFHFESIPSDYRQTNNLQKLFKEVYKFFKTSTFLLFWDRNETVIHQEL
jgi:uncharacterized SAM-binding protein YcdF (DUF218 family)